MRTQPENHTPENKVKQEPSLPLVFSAQRRSGADFGVDQTADGANGALEAECAHGNQTF